MVLDEKGMTENQSYNSSLREHKYLYQISGNPSNSCHSFNTTNVNLRVEIEKEPGDQRGQYHSSSESYHGDLCKKKYLYIFV